MTAALGLFCALAAGVSAQTTISAQPVTGVGLATSTATSPFKPGAPAQTGVPTGPQTAPPTAQPTAPMGYSRPGADFTTPTAPFIGVSTPPVHRTPQTAPGATAPAATAPAVTAPAATSPATTRATGGKSSKNDRRRPAADVEAVAKQGGSTT